MNKLYIPALAVLLVAESTVAQQASTTMAPGSAALRKTHTAADIMASHPQHPGEALGGERGPSFYSEDFSGGSIPAGWTNTDDLTPVGDPNVTFVWSNDPDAVEPAALGYTPSATFNAPSASNGYLWANSDRGLPAAPASNHLTHLTTSAIDCSGQASVLLTFESLIGVYDLDANTNVKLRVSTDLATWTDFSPFPCLVTGGAAPPCSRWSANPQSVAINITSVAAGQSTVYLQWEWMGGWEYFWAIDDIAFSPLPDHEISMNYAYTSHTGFGDEYGRIPTSQLPSTMNMGVEVWNFGGMDQTNVTVNVSVMDESSTEVFTATEAIGTIASGDTAYMDQDVPLPALAVGLFTATFTVTSDQIGSDVDPTNNSRIRTFRITDDVYSIDGIGDHPAGTEVLSQTGTASFADNTEDVKLLVWYPIITEMEFTGALIKLGPATEAGSFLSVTVHDSTAVFDLDFTGPIAESDFYYITAEDVDAGEAGIAFLDPVTLSPGSYYLSANMYQDASVPASPKDLFILDDETVPQPAWTSALYTPVDPTNNQFLYGGNGQSWAVRLSADPSIGISENTELTGVSMYPNPTNGIVNIATEHSGNHTVTVFNVLGEVMMTNTFVGNTKIDLTPFADGVYSVRIANENGSMIQRITLN